MRKRRELPIVIDVHSALAIEYVADVAKIVKQVLKTYGIRRKLHLKPAIFSRTKVYEEQALCKPFIYTH